MEINDKYSNQKILDRERYYSEKYNVYEEGFCIHIGGGRFKEEKSTQGVRLLEDTDNVIKAKAYIERYWVDKRINKKQREVIGNVIRDKYNIKFTRFKIVIRQLGFKVLSYKDHQHWYIKGSIEEGESEYIFQKHQRRWLYTPNKPEK
ncbi:hypothetical protein [Clostridium sp.]|uniref:hypothetical protein n=1 Tax=Clostridium sp. TaxID=1506 RepID=UPI0026372331|nr:hypothetical protein [Clostridium sp.]